MPWESDRLKGFPFAKESCPKCSAPFPEFMRGQVQSSIRKYFDFAYCAVICHMCKKVIGWEHPYMDEEQYRAQQAAKLTAANARIAELEGALREAIESVEDWAGYASAYFREKHDLEGEVKKLRAALGEQ